MVERVGLSALFICTHNSARSIMAEAILNKKRVGVRGYSAGSAPRGAVHPLAAELLGSFGHDVSSLRAKSWDEFAGPDAPNIDFMIALCDHASGETCPTWPGRPIAANWAVRDPCAEDGGAVARRVAFVRAYRELEQRIDAFFDEGLVATAFADEATRQVIQDRLDLVGEMMCAPTGSDLTWPGRPH